MHTQPKHRHYRSYLLRLWKVLDHRTDARLVWRCSLEDPHTGDRRGFASLEALLTFLQGLETQDEPEDTPVDAGSI